jgi:hypothetical protein
MMATAVHTSPAAAHFPEQRVKTALEDWWAEETAARRADPFARPGTLFDVVPDIDSLSLVNALLVVEAEIGFKPPVTVIKRGGYQDCSEMLQHLLPAIRRSYEKKHR